MARIGLGASVSRSFVSRRAQQRPRLSRDEACDRTAGTRQCGPCDRNSILRARWLTSCYTSLQICNSVDRREGHFHGKVTASRGGSNLSKCNSCQEGGANISPSGRSSGLSRPPSRTAAGFSMAAGLRAGNGCPWRVRQCVLQSAALHSRQSRQLPSGLR
jgi:hypothetical protein